MKTRPTMTTIAVWTLMVASAAAGAGTLGSAYSKGKLVGTGDPVTPTVVMTGPTQQFVAYHTIGANFAPGDTKACGARGLYTDGTSSANLTFSPSTKSVTLDRAYNKPGLHGVTVNGFKHSNLPECANSASTTFIIEDGMTKKPMAFAPVIQELVGQKPAKPGANTGAMTPAALAQPAASPINAKAIVHKLVLMGGAVYSAGAVPLNSTISVNGLASTCLLTYTVTTANEGPGAINFELFRANLNGGTASAAPFDYNPGTVTIANGGKFHAAVTARTDSANQCTGQASADFEVKPPPAPKANYGSMVTKIVSVVDTSTYWIVNVHGSGSATCNYHLRTLSLPEKALLSDNAMVYVSGNIDVGKGSLTVQKPAANHGVRFEVYESSSDKVDNKGCLGEPSLELNVIPVKLDVAIALPSPLPKPGTITGLTILGQSFAVGQAINANLSATGVSCGYTIKARPLPFINLNNDIPLASKTYGKTNMDWDLSNLGQALTPGNWTVFIQPALPGELAPGELSCVLPPAGKAQVFFTVKPS